MIAECQVLVLALDHANTAESLNFKMADFWFIIFMSSLFYMTVILPFSLFYTETDEEKTFVSCFLLSDRLRLGAFAPHLKMS